VRACVRACVCVCVCGHAICVFQSRALFNSDKLQSRNKCVGRSGSVVVVKRYTPGDVSVQPPGVTAT
jgi:hypothetical protein